MCGMRLWEPAVRDMPCQVLNPQSKTSETCQGSYWWVPQRPAGWGRDPTRSNQTSFLRVANSQNDQGVSESRRHPSFSTGLAATLQLHKGQCCGSPTHRVAVLLSPPPAPQVAAQPLCPTVNGTGTLVPRRLRIFVGLPEK